MPVCMYTSITIRFQFQCGAIKRFDPKYKDCPIYVFQFQCGAIKSVFCTIKGFFVRHFNSSVVRLKENINEDYVSGI